jgi:anti-sigma-K factor RskA
MQLDRADSLCESIEPLLAAYALGDLDPTDRALIEGHLAGCARCRRLLATYQSLARLLPLAAIDDVPDLDLRGRVADAVAGAARGDRPAAQPQWAPARPLWRRPLPLLAGLALAALLVWNIVLQIGQIGERAERAEREAALVALIESPNRASLPLAPSEVAPGASGAIVADRSGAIAVVSLAGMPPLPPGRVYQLWLVQGEQDRISGGTFTVDAAGAATIVVRTPEPIGVYRAVGVTVEPTGGSPGPTSPRVIGGPLSS